MLMDQILSFRLMELTDLPSVLKNERSSYSHPWSEGVFRECLQGVSECWVASSEGAVVGHAVISAAVGEGHLLNLCIGAPWRGRSLGQQFLNFLLLRFKELEVSTLFLEVRVSNQVALALYKKNAFDQIGLRKNYYPSANGSEDAVVMSLAISSDGRFR